MTFSKNTLICMILLLFSFKIYAQNSNGSASAKNESKNNANSQVTVYTKKQLQLRITAQNIRLFQDKKNGGYHLYIKKLPGVESVLLTETTKDPTGKNDSYAYRAKEYNSVNGDEIRVLDGKTLVSEGSKYSLVDSSVEDTDFFGPAFHIYIPQVLVYGYDWSRKGEIEIQKGTFINIRSFEKPYADYSGDFVDNPFMFDFIKKPAKKVEKKDEKKVENKSDFKIEDKSKIEDKRDETVLTDDFNPAAYENLKNVSEEIVCSKGPVELIKDLRSVLEEDKDSEVDIVFTIDTTGSMKDDMEQLKKDFVPLLEELFGDYSKARVGIVLYRDYGDSYNYMGLPVKVYSFMQSSKQIQKILNGVYIYGKEGGDIPEAVYEALYASAEFFEWRAESKKRIIWIGDAEPHPLPRKTGKYSKETAMNAVNKKGIKINSILLPKD